MTTENNTKLSNTPPPKKLALVNDLAGYGRCSLTAAIPIVSQLGVQCCPVPTAVFSNHTGYPVWHMTDYTKELPDYLSVWKQLNFSFDGILTGFLSNQAQANIIRQFLQDFKKTNTLYILDPAMGDHGRAYATCGKEIQESMRSLVALADVVTPNVTEACLLTDTPYRPDFTKKELIQMAEKLLKMGPKQVVITGIPCKSCVGNLCMTEMNVPSDGNPLPENAHRQEKEAVTLLRTKKVAQLRHGTGDIFSAILAAKLLKETSDEGLSFRQETLTAAVRKASAFVRKCLLVSDAADIPLAEGVCFEKILYQLK